MKKAKIMLTAITVLAVVGGALAFKAGNFTDTTLYCTDGANQACDISFATYRVTIDPEGTTDSFCDVISHTGLLGDVCPPVKVKPTN